MELTKESLESYYESLPDNDELKDFDSFLLGSGNALILEDQSFEDIGCDLTSEFDITQEDDKGEFIELSYYDSLEVLTDSFKNIKRDIFTKFDYFKVLSSEYKYPVRVEDLVLSNTDKFLVTYLFEGNIDKFSVECAAKLSAYKSMNFEKVTFKALDGCPLCSCKNNLQYDISYLFDIYCSGSYLSHPGCKCDLLPVIDHSIERSFTVSDDFLVESTKLIGVPLEFSEYIVKVVEESPKKYDEICFVDLKEYLWDSYEDNLVIFEEESMGKKKLILGNLYIGFYNSLYFLENWMFDTIDEVKKEEAISVDPDNYQDRYIYNGREIFRYKGDFYDCETKELVNLEDI